MANTDLLLFGTCLYLAAVASVATSEMSAEGKLIKLLTSPDRYERFASPTSTNYTAVLFSLYADKIPDIDDKKQESTLACYLILQWKDKRLSWNATEHEGIDTLLFSSDQIWVPDIGLHNSLDAEYDLADKAKYRIPVTAEGVAEWYPGSQFRVGCNLDMTRFPFDEQACYFRFGSWSQSARYIRMVARSDDISYRDGFIPNGQWSRVSSHIRDEVYKPNVELSGWSRVWVIVRLKRRPVFYIMNVIIPCIAISVLVLMVFNVPSESGEKVSLGVTVLLAFSVFQLVMADTLPKTSKNIPIIVIYLTTLMVTSAISTILAVLILNIHGISGKKEMPLWMQRFIFNWLATVVFMRNVTSEFRVETKVGRGLQKNPAKASKLEKKSAQNGDDFVPAVSNGAPRLTTLTSLGQMAVKAAKEANETNENRKADDAFAQLLHEQRRKREKKEAEEKEARVKRQWVLASRIIDRFLMITYFILYAALTLTCLVILPNMPQEEAADAYSSQAVATLA
ncbi:neuronal acetylcholine receptor subunit alpha-7-like [Lineus longissimus]|uniref:neuronal acetylcholine receptor subunit alpha-7-like n=1 Tax=Lineus longissimus TaxID=88925 RepID=UPI002B4F8325